MATLSLFGRLRRFLGNRRAAPRLTAQVDARLLLLLPGSGTAAAAPQLAGQTVDVSQSGLALLVTTPVELLPEGLPHGSPEINITLSLPTGSVELQAIIARAIHVKQEPSAHAYFIGAQIAQISEVDRARYQGYLLMLQD